ncbi:MAG: hypothetical protein ABIP03_00030 [Aquihabitans sp.]
MLEGVVAVTGAFVVTVALGLAVEALAPAVGAGPVAGTVVTMPVTGEAVAFPGAVLAATVLACVELLSLRSVATATTPSSVTITPPTAIPIFIRPIEEPLPVSLKGLCL